MNMLKQLNAAIEYIEANLCAEFDLDTAAGIACVTADSFIRFFSYMTGMTLNEYVRRRRLTLAAQDIQHSTLHHYALEEWQAEGAYRRPEKIPDHTNCQRISE